jgi:acyl-CoA reductase-like NAD-dependent aldehyde dehydrogenase
MEKVRSRSISAMFGLDAGIFSRNMVNAMGIAEKAGSLRINRYESIAIKRIFRCYCPFGEPKKFGGCSDEEQYALDNYVEVKTINFSTQ